MTEKNIFVHKHFYSIFQILVYFLCKNSNPRLEKDYPSDSQQPHSKYSNSVNYHFLKIWQDVQSASRKEGIHNMRWLQDNKDAFTKLSFTKLPTFVQEEGYNLPKLLFNLKSFTSNNRDTINTQGIVIALCLKNRIQLNLKIKFNMKMYSWSVNTSIMHYHQSLTTGSHFVLVHIIITQLPPMQVNYSSPPSERKKFYNYQQS